MRSVDWFNVVAWFVLLVGSLSAWAMVGVAVGVL